MVRDVVGAATHVWTDSRLLHDLKIYGDDAWYLFDDIAEKFDINSCLFDGTEYFPNDHEFPCFIERLLNKSALSKWKEMTVSDLANMLEQAKTNRTGE
ncbi:MAG: DUF1493 family protein [Sphingomonadales bacterium]|jgi:hypothetical protein